MILVQCMHKTICYIFDAYPHLSGQKVIFIILWNKRCVKSWHNNYGLIIVYYQRSVTVTAYFQFHVLVPVCIYQLFIIYDELFINVIAYYFVNVTWLYTNCVCLVPSRRQQKPENQAAVRTWFHAARNIGCIGWDTTLIYFQYIQSLWWCNLRYMQYLFECLGGNPKSQNLFIYGGREQGRHLSWLGGRRPPRKKKKEKKEKKKKREKKKKERKKGTMNNVKLLHIKCCFFPIFQ